MTITRREKMDQYDDSDEVDEIVKPPQGPPWPNRYGDGSLRLTVPPEGTTEANFDLTLKE
ncbi:MAG: hypothetical protein IH831_10720 [Planctomycetes bacterium]|nr:hypothetical protein [Planctomycetota bacterium]